MLLDGMQSQLKRGRKAINPSHNHMKQSSNSRLESSIRALELESRLIETRQRLQSVEAAQQRETHQVSLWNITDLPWLYKLSFVAIYHSSPLLPYPWSKE